MSARDQSYIDAMNEFRNGTQIAAAPQKTRQRDETTTTIVATDRLRVRNPLSVNSRYPRARSFEKDLLRYYEECSLSRSAARFKGERKKSYCARVAWARIKTTGRYPDYPGFARKEDAMKKRKRTEKRNRKGQFVKASAKRKPAKRTHRKAPTRKAARRHRARPAARRAAPRRHRARAPIAVATSPRRRRRRTTRRYAREMPAPFASMSGAQAMTVAAAPRRRRRRARAPVAVAAAPRRRRHKTTRRRSARRGYSRESLAAMEERICRNVYRTAGGRFRKPKRRRAKRRVMAAPKRRRRVSAHRRQGRRVKSYLRAGDMISNPISGGEIGVLVGVTALGYLLTDVMSRFLQSEPSGFAPSGTDLAVPNAASVLGFPSWWNIGAQAGLSLVGFVAGAEVSKGGKGGMGSAALYGVGLGAGVHLVSQLFTAGMARWAGSKTSSQGTTPNGTLARLYSGEIAAQNSQFTVQTQAQAATPAGNARPGFAGPPEGQLGYSPVQFPQYVSASAELPAGASDARRTRAADLARRLGVSTGRNSGGAALQRHPAVPRRVDHSAVAAVRSVLRASRSGQPTLGARLYVRPARLDKSPGRESVLPSLLERIGRSG